jgi:hypothetical protein
MINIKGLDKAKVLCALYDASKPLGMGFLHYTPEPMQEADAQDLLLKEYRYFDYLRGRVMKVDLRGDEFDPALYDRDNGQGAAERALREAGLL